MVAVRGCFKILCYAFCSAPVRFTLQLSRISFGNRLPQSPRNYPNAKRRFRRTHSEGNAVFNIAFGLYLNYYAG